MIVPCKACRVTRARPLDVLRGATREALGNLVSLAIEEKVAFVLLSGDLYDGDWRDYHTGLFLMQQLSRLREAGIKVYVIYGNHDAESRITKSLRFPDNVRVLSTKSPETIILDDFGVAIHGQGFAKRDVMENLAEQYPDARKGFFNIGMLHTALTGAEGHAPYAPCTLGTLQSKGYDVWALGHVHARKVHSRGASDPVPGEYPGPARPGDRAQGVYPGLRGRRPGGLVRAQGSSRRAVGGNSRGRLRSIPPRWMSLTLPSPP